MRRQQRLRRRNFLLGAESLELRIALSMNIGVNLNFNALYNGDPIWTDLHNLAMQWEAPTVTIGWTSVDTAIPLTADDYPLADAATSFNLTNYPDGDYEFSYTGTATVAFTDIGQLAGPVTVSNGVTTGTVVVNHDTGDGTALDMQVTGLDPANPMDNFHLMMPGYGNGTTPEPMFTPAFLHALEPFSTIRFMQWEQTNGSTLSNWSDRVSPTDFITDGPGGVPYEDMIELCNDAQKDMWINIPAMATPQFVQSLAQLISAELDPNLNVYLEYGNENWNASFSQYGLILAAAKANPLVTQNVGALQMIGQQSAYEEVSDAQVFEQVFGSASARVRPVLAGWCYNSNYQQYELQFIQQTYGPPAQFIYATAVAPYIALPNGDNVAGLTLNEIFADLNQYLTSDIVPWLQSDAAVAEQYGVPLIAYEGGQSMVPGANDLNLSVMQQAQSDPRMYQLYIALMNDWQQVGGGLFEAFMLDGATSQIGLFGMLPNVLATGSEEYDALVSLIFPAGDANLDGTVDEADFQILEANYGDTNAYWTQGDFNDDGIVNWQDLNILRQNLDPAGFTLDQFAQQALYGQPSPTNVNQTEEFGGYGVTYVTSSMIASSSNGSGSVMINENSQGEGINLYGLDYTQGLGVVANSSITIPLNGAYSRFESTIGVDYNTTTTAGKVIFEVYGDGALLYQSPVVAYAAGTPIEVNVAGVQQLVLEVVAAPGSNSAIDHAVWAEARLVSTQNFGATPPYTLTWQVTNSQGKVLATFTGDSYFFGSTVDGDYTITLTVTDGQGDTATQSTQIIVGPHGPYWFYTYPGNDQVELDWESMSSSGAASYDIYRSTSADPETMVLYQAGVTVPKFIDTGVTNGTTYYYEVVPVDANGFVGIGTFAKPTMPAALVSANTLVSSMTFLSTSGTVVRNRSALPDSFGDGLMMPLAMWGNPYTSGLGVQGNSSIQVALSGGYTTFSTMIGLDTQDPSGGAVVYQVVADGKTLYTSPAMTLSLGYLSINLNVAGYNVLDLLTTVVSGSGDAVDADWGNTQLVPANITLVTSLPITSANGSHYGVNANVLGSPLMIGGNEYAQGIGVAAFSGLTINTDGAYSTFTATIGIDSLVSAAGASVNFEIIGDDGKGLYWSPLITPATAPISISINISGVQTLHLCVVYGNSIVNDQDYADWALAELHP